jgi:hypothetical protein
MKRPLKQGIFFASVCRWRKAREEVVEGYVDCDDLTVALEASTLKDCYYLSVGGKEVGA